ncbi:LuxR family transcriptional regulator [Mariniluteicoccus flavus]
MIGRAPELERLRTAWGDAATTPWWFIGGDAGMGKTTLVNALVAAVGDDGLVVIGQCVPMADEGLPLVPATQVLRHLIDACGREAVLEWAGAGRAALGGLVPELGEPTRDGQERLRMFEAFARVLEGAARRRPLLVVIEDLHWSDATTRELLRFLRVAVTGVPIMVVATFRTDEVTRRHPLRPWLSDILRTPHTERVELEPLDDADSRDLIDALLGGDPDPARVDTIIERGEGIPYFLEELSRCASEGCDMTWSLREALLVRVTTLPESTQSLLRLASAAGNRVSHALLATVAGLPDTTLDADLRAALDAHILNPDETGYCFHHALLREAIHDDVLPGEHTRLHDRFADALEADPSLGSRGELVHHLFAGGRLDRALRAAIDLARDESLPVLESLALFERVLDIWDRVPDAAAYAGPRHRVLDETARAAITAGLAPRSLKYADAALAAMPADVDPGERAATTLIRGRGLANLMDARAAEAYTEVLAAADGTPQLRLTASAELAGYLMLRCDLDAARAQIDDALALADDVGPSLERNAAMARLLNVRGCVANHLGEEEAFEADLARSLEFERPSSWRWYDVNMSDGLYVAGHFRRAADVALTGMQKAADLGLERSVGAMLAGNAALPLLTLGDTAAAHALVTRALALRPPEKYLLQLDTLDSSLRLADGDLDGAERALLAFRERRRDQVLFYPQYAVDHAQAEALLAIERGDHDTVDRQVDLVARLGGAGRGTAAWLVHAAGARSLRERGLDVRAGMKDPGRLDVMRAAPVWHALFDAEADDTAAGWRAVVDHPMAESLGASVSAYARLQLARTLAAGDRAEARSVWTAGRAEAVRIAHRPLVGAYDAVATRAGIAPTSAATVLTPREREVIGLVTEGLSNGEIAGRLVISTKTASVHVSNILAKLGASSRTQAATIARRRGLI